MPDWSPLDRLSYEFGAIGFYLSAHPLDTKRAQLERLNIITYADVEAKIADRPVARVKMAGVLIKKTEKISAKSGNKFAILTLSDSSGVYEVMLFTEILMRSRSMLEPGEALLLMADAEQRDEQIRITVQDIKLLDPSLEGQIKGVQVTLNKETAIPTLKALLESAGKGTARINLVVGASGGRRVEISLPGQYAFTAETRNALFQTSGITAIQEL